MKNRYVFDKGSFSSRKPYSQKIRASYPMTETKNSQHEPALPTKRQPNLVSQDHDHQQQTLPNKSPKLQTLDQTVQSNQQNHALDNGSSVPEPVPENEDTLIELEEEEEEEKEDDDYEDDDDDDEEENGSTPVDRKGKGIMIEEVNDNDDDDDSSDDGDESEGESDLSDDPLAEVDLDNILPSRTRRSAAYPGVRIVRGSDGSDS